MIKGILLNGCCTCIGERYFKLWFTIVIVAAILLLRKSQPKKKASSRKLFGCYLLYPLISASKFLEILLYSIPVPILVLIPIFMLHRLVLTTIYNAIKYFPHNKWILFCCLMLWEKWNILNEGVEELISTIKPLVYLSRGMMLLRLGLILLWPFESC